MRHRLLLRALAGTLMVTLAACNGNDAQEDTFADCGNGVVDPGEQCDLGPENSDSGPCLTDCQLARCGDGFIWRGVEACDTLNLAGATCQSQGFGEGSVTCAACEFNVSACGAPFTPSPTRTATPLPTSTPTPTATPTAGEATPTPAAVCDPLPATRTIDVAYQPPAAGNATSIRIALQYDATVAGLPEGSAARERVTVTQARTSVSQVDNTDDTLRARVAVRSLTDTIAPGAVLEVVFNLCAGSRSPTDGDFRCTIEDCAPGLLGCTCTASVR